jgi:hypothetical protein
MHWALSDRTCPRETRGGPASPDKKQVAEPSAEKTAIPRVTIAVKGTTVEAWPLA